MSSRGIGIVTISLNDRVGLERTVRSIHSQATAPVEWHIVDGGSTDGSVDFVNGSELGFLTSFSSGPDGGIYDAMQRGLERCETCDYVLFLHAGDELRRPDSLQQASHELSKASGIDVAYFGWRLVSPSGRTVERQARKPSYIWHGLPANQQATLYRRGLLADSPLVPREFPICGDYWMSANLLVGGARAASFPLVLSDFYLGGVSSREWQRNMLESIRIQRSVLGLARWKVLMSAGKRLISITGARVLASVPRG